MAKEKRPRKYCTEVLFSTSQKTKELIQNAQLFHVFDKLTHKKVKRFLGDLKQFPHGKS